MKSNIIFYLLIITLLQNKMYGQDELLNHPGNKLFTTNCSPCHKPDKKLIGPGLNGVRERRSQEWILSFVKNSSEMIASGDEQAVNIFNEYKKIIMPNQNLKDEEIIQILDYIDLFNKTNEPQQTATSSNESAGATTQIYKLDETFVSKTNFVDVSLMYSMYVLLGVSVLTLMFLIIYYVTLEGKRENK